MDIIIAIVCLLIVIAVIIVGCLRCKKPERFNMPLNVKRKTNTKLLGSNISNGVIDQKVQMQNFQNNSLFMKVINSPLRLLKQPKILNFTQVINKLNMYATYYEFFDVPDADLPSGLLILDQNFLPDLSEEIISPIGMRNFSWHKNIGKYVANNDTFKKCPYLIKPIILQKYPLPIDPRVVAGFQKVFWWKEVVASDIDQYLIAEGTYTSSKPIKSKLSGNYFEVTKNVNWNVHLKMEFVYKPIKLGAISKYLTNKELAYAIHYDPPATVDPSQTFSYYFNTDMTLSTTNKYVRDVANEPAPGIGPFDADLKKIEMIGRPVDRFGNYSIVGYTQNNNYFDEKFFKFTIPNVANILLNKDLRNKPVEFAFQETGTILYI